MLGPKEFQSKFVSFAESPQADPQYFRECLDEWFLKAGFEGGSMGLEANNVIHMGSLPQIHWRDVLNTFSFFMLCLKETLDGSNQELSFTKQRGKDWI